MAIKVGIMSAADYRARTLSIAKGEYTPKRGDPKIWFESIQSLSQVLCENNLDLLKIIRDYNPSSLSELSEISKRAESNLSRTLKTLESHGIVSLHRSSKGIKPKVRATDFKVEFGISKTPANDTNPQRRAVAR